MSSSGTKGPMHDPSCTSSIEASQIFRRLSVTGTNCPGPRERILNGNLLLSLLFAGWPATRRGNRAQIGKPGAGQQSHKLRASPGRGQCDRHSPLGCSWGLVHIWVLYMSYISLLSIVISVLSYTYETYISFKWHKNISRY